MITIVDVLDVIINKIIGLEKIPEEKKEKYIEIIVKAAAEGLANSAKERAK